MTIDLVIPMVFPSDPLWRNDYVRSGMGGDAATEHVRFRSWGTEQLLIRCCMKYMPWLRYIHILLASESQVQPWMKQFTIGNGQSDKPQVRLVFHRDFIPGNLLPCFNVNTIEMHLHRIPDLAEHFIYSNDDFYPLSPQKPDDFFRYSNDEGECRLLPCQHHNEEPHPDPMSTFHKFVMNGLNMVAADFGKKFTDNWLHGGHSMAPMLKSTVEKVCSLHADRIGKSFSMGRSEKNFNQYIFTFYQHLSGEYIDHHPRRSYVGPTVPLDELARVIRDENAGIVCVNDAAKMSDWEERAELVRREIAAKVNRLSPIPVLIVHFNTPELTSAAIRSLRMHTPDTRVTLFDNSDRLPFPHEDFPDVEYIDNTKGQVINFRKWLEQFPYKVPTPENDWGSAKHCYTIDFCMDRFPEGFMLMDSDVLLKRDISDLCDTSVAWKGGVHTNTKRFGLLIPRVIPFLCWINTPMLREHGIRYFNGAKMWNIVPTSPENHYDTGAWLLEACNEAGLQGCRVEIRDYIEHYGHASWREHGSAYDWLQERRGLWQNCENTVIFVASHSQFRTVCHNPVYKTVNAASINGDVCENGLRGAFYSELFIYRHIAMQDDLPEYVGFCGYRKYFSFMDNVPDIPSIFREYDAIAATPVRVKPDVRIQYARCHNVNDLDIVTGIIREHYPDLWPTYERSLRQPDLYACNMFILRRDDFKALMETVWDILDRYLEVVGMDIDGRLVEYADDYHIGTNTVSTPRYQYRIGGFLGERIINAILRQRFRNILHFNRVVTSPPLDADPK